MPALRPRVIGGDQLSSTGRIPVAAAAERDSVASALAKWVPVEVIVFYEGITTPFGSQVSDFLWYAIIVGILVVILWIAFATEEKAKSSRIAWRQVIVSPFAFLFWVAGTTSPDIWKIIYPWWQVGFNPAILAFGVVALPIIDGILRRLGLPQD
jgi:hypothetical protein